MRAGRSSWVSRSRRLRLLAALVLAVSSVLGGATGRRGGR